MGGVSCLVSDFPSAFLGLGGSFLPLSAIEFIVNEDDAVGGEEHPGA